MKASLIPSLVLALSLIPACVITTEDDPVYVDRGNGLLTLEWTLGGTTDPIECDATDSEVIEISITQSGGRVIDQFVESCDRFAASVELMPGTYRAEAVLLDPSGRERTTTVGMGTFDIYGDDELILDVDFPPSSFY
jgi:hypothetical protein